jgi:hypothetical protein
MKAKALIAALTLLLTPVSAAADTACSADSVSLRGDWGEARFTVELADTNAERAQGLMFRESMARQAGMLFVYEYPQRAVFWMKNTLISLDMIFVDQTGRVTSVHHQAIPGDLTPIDGGHGVFAVLEINGGLARSYGITEGSELRHQIFAGGPAIWPC